MTKPEALALIDAHKNQLINPLEMLRWTWLRVIVNQIPDDMWEHFVAGAVDTLAR